MRVCSATQSCLTLQTHGLWPPRLLSLWDFPGKNTGVGCHFLLQAIVLNQESNRHLLHWQADSLPLSHLGSPGPIHLPDHCPKWLLCWLLFKIYESNWGFGLIVEILLKPEAWDALTCVLQSQFSLTTVLT